MVCAGPGALGVREGLGVVSLGRLVGRLGHGRLPLVLRWRPPVLRPWGLGWLRVKRGGLWVVGLGRQVGPLGCGRLPLAVLLRDPVLRPWGLAPATQHGPRCAAI